MFIIVILALVAVGAFAILRIVDDNSPANTQSPSKKSSTKNKKGEESYPIVNLQPTLNSWAAKQSGTASVVVYDLANEKIIGSLNPDRQYFAASLYKLFVAYLGYQKVADGTDSLNEAYRSNYTRGECLDAMIRESYSPCGEQMASEFGSTAILKMLKDYGFENTAMSGAYTTTSANDVAIILERLFKRQDLSEKHTKLYLDSMKTQPALYRRGLPSGFRDSIVYNKVGWNGQVEWHDAAIVTLPNDRSYVVVVLTENVGTTNIIALARALEAKLSK